MKNKLIYLIYVFLSNLPDFYMFGFWFRNITKLRAKALNLLPNMKIADSVKIYRNVNISRHSNIILDENVTIKENCVIGGNLEVGNDSLILANVHLDCSGSLKIGYGSVIGREVHIYTHKYALNLIVTSVLKSPEIFERVVIGNNVLLFSRVGVMSGVSIENNVVVAYGSIVTKDLPENSICAGTPTKILGYRK